MCIDRVHLSIRKSLHEKQHIEKEHSTGLYKILYFALKILRILLCLFYIYIHCHLKILYKH
jgi:hypothetical protein